MGSTSEAWKLLTIETLRRVAQTYLFLAFRSETVGAPSLRFVQGRVTCCRERRFYLAAFESSSKTLRC